MNILKDAESNAIVGLGTNQHTCANTSLYVVDVRTTIVPTSGLSIVINLNGSPVATSTAPGSNDIFASLHASMECVPTDIITVVLSSSTLQDILNLNNVKSVISINRV